MPVLRTQPLPGAVCRALEEGRFLSAAEVARALNVTRQFVYSAEYDGRLPGVRVGRALRFSPETIAEFLRDGGDG